MANIESNFMDMRKTVLLILLCICSFLSYSQGGSRGLHRKSSTLPFNPALKPFYHGVASGDPLSDRVIIWTRVTPETPVSSITVEWLMATDTGLKNIVKSGTATTDSTKDYTVKVDVTGLLPATTYYYAFKKDNVYSTIGRARTAPVGNTDHLRFAVVSCNNYEGGFYNGFARIADRNDLDAVIHLGDYIYEYAAKQYGDSTTGRFVEPEKEAVTLGDYRTRYSIYKLDADLQRAHQQQTFITIWDDHESSNDSYKDGAQNHQPATEGDWEIRREISKQVYFEWMPIRDYPDNKIYRNIHYGNMADLIMLDTRLEGRDPLPANFDTPDTPARAMLGSKQYQWFMNELKNSQAHWKVIGNQVVFSDFNVGFAARNGQGLPAPDDINAIRDAERVFLNFWDSYPTERNAIIDTIDKADIKNVVFITGDSHCSWAFDVTKQPAIYPDTANNNYASPSPTYNAVTGEGSVAVEFCTPSISSANFDERTGVLLANMFEGWVNTPISFLNNSNYNPHMKYADVDQHGYFILDLKSDSAQAGFYYSIINKPSPKETFAKNVFTLSDSGHVLMSNSPAKGKAKQETPAPDNKPVSVSVAEIEKAIVFHAYPNPAQQVFNIQYGIGTESEVNITIYAINGKEVSHWQQKQRAGLYNYNVDVSNWMKGTYLFKIVTGKATASGKFLVE